MKVAYYFCTNNLCAMSLDLSEKDKKVYTFIRERFAQGGSQPKLREILEITGDKSSRSGKLVLNRLEKAGLISTANGFLKLTSNSLEGSSSISTVDVPLIGTVTCGTPVLAIENIEAYIPVSTNLVKRGDTYFLLRASGTSMNKAGIRSGDILLVRQQSTAENGDKVVALIDDDVTVKIFERKGGVVILHPKSTDARHKPFIISHNCQIQGVVKEVLPKDVFDNNY